MTTSESEAERYDRDLLHLASARHLEGQTEIISKALPVLFQAGTESAFNVGVLLQCLLDTAQSLVLLAVKEKMRDALALARVAVETAVNAAYLCAGGADVSETAMAHARQKAFRDLDRESIIGARKLQMKWGMDPIEPSAEMREALQRFTGARGQELSDWTDASLPARIAAIEERFGERVATRLHFALFWTYRHGSEVIHGTLFSGLFAIGATDPRGVPPDAASLRDRHITHIGTTLTMVSAAAVSALICAGALVDLGSAAAEADAKLKEHLDRGPQ